MDAKKKTALWWVALLGGLLAVNALASRLHWRADLTEDNRYSLTPATRQTVGNLAEPVEIDVFLQGELPTGFRRLANSTQEFLSVLKDANPGRIRHRFVSPDEDAGNGRPWADSLRNAGVEPINLSVQVKAGEENKNIFPYALVRARGRTEVVNLFPSSKRTITVAELNNAEALMEYGFVKSFESLFRDKPTVVAYATGNGEPTGGEIYDLQQIVSGRYVMRPFDLTRFPYIPSEANVLLVVKPATAFTEAEKLKMDQYLMRGGKLLLFLDNLFAEGDSLAFTRELVAYDRGLNLGDLLFNYGVRINADLVMDLQSDFLPFAVGGTPAAPQYEFLRWNYYPLFESRGNHPVNRNLGLVAGRYVNSLDTVEAAGVRKIFLLQSSANARSLSTPALISTNENRNTPQDALFNRGGIPVGVLLEGRFASLYRNRVSAAQQDSLKKSGGFRAETATDGKLIVVADGDMPLNDVSGKEGPLPMGTNLYTVGSRYEYQFANRDFVLNCLEYLTGDAALIGTRNKEVVLRLLDPKKVEAERSRWQAVNLVLPIALVVLAGAGYHWLRRRRYGAGA